MEIYVERIIWSITITITITIWAVIMRKRLPVYLRTLLELPCALRALVGFLCYSVLQLWGKVTSPFDEVRIKYRIWTGTRILVKLMVSKREAVSRLEALDNEVDLDPDSRDVLQKKIDSLEQMIVSFGNTIRRSQALLEIQQAAEEVHTLEDLKEFVNRAESLS